MVEVNLGALKVSAQGGPWALTLYQREFKESGKRFDWYADHEEAFAEADEAVSSNDGITNLEYIGKVEPLFLLRTLWACVKNADDETPSFEAWLKTLDISMSPYAMWKWEVFELIKAELFRIPQVEANTEAEEEPEK